MSGCDRTIGQKRPSARRGDGTSKLLRHARGYYDRGLIPVPVTERVPRVRWEHRLGWKTKALKGELPPWDEVVRAFRWAEVHRNADGIAVILPPGVVVIDPDTDEGERGSVGSPLGNCRSAPA